jgi:uncharacterized membrane protein
LCASAIGVAGRSSFVLLAPGTIAFLSARHGWTRTTLVVHALTGAAALLAGLVQLQTGPERPRRALHRALGRLCVLAMVAASLSGGALAMSTRGGVAARAGFLVLSLLWLFTTTRAVLAIRAGHMASHRMWMLRAFALTFSAVTLRVYLGLGVAFGLRFLEVYALSAWLCWVPNLLLVEWWWLPRSASGSGDRGVSRRDWVTMMHTTGTTKQPAV